MQPLLANIPERVSVGSTSITWNECKGTSCTSHKRMGRSVIWVLILQLSPVLNVHGTISLQRRWVTMGQWFIKDEWRLNNTTPILSWEGGKWNLHNNKAKRLKTRNSTKLKTRFLKLVHRFIASSSDKNKPTLWSSAQNWHRKISSKFLALKSYAFIDIDRKPKGDSIYLVFLVRAGRRGS